jgi:hypothetical protein
MLLMMVKNKHGKAIDDIILLHDSAHPHLAQRVQNQWNAM